MYGGHCPPAVDERSQGFGLSTTTCVVTASMIGTGILVSPGYMMASLGDYPVIFGLWTLGGMPAMCGALCVAELATALPRLDAELHHARQAGPVRGPGDRRIPFG